MAAIILTGSNNNKEEYIKKYILENQIPDYYVVRFDTPLKISEAKEIINNLSQKIQEKMSRLFVISAQPTLEAQNALLKTIEEMDSNSTIIFMTDNVLPTISSRSRLINLEVSLDVNVDQQAVDLFSNYLQSRQTLSSSLLLADTLFSEKREDPIRDIILILRKLMFDSLMNKKNNEVKFISSLLEDLTRIYPTVVSNNLNSRLIFERILLSRQVIKIAP